MAMKTQNLKYFGVTILTFKGHVMSSVTRPSDLAWALSYWWSMMTIHLSCTDTEITDVISHVTIELGIPIGGPLDPCVYLSLLRRYKASNLYLPMLKAKSSLRMLLVT